MSERRALQIAIALAGLVPVTAGALGAFRPDLLALAGAPPALTHLAYLSGLLLGIGVAFWSLIPSIEKQKRIFSLLTAIVVLGGLMRLLTAIRLQSWGLAASLPLVMELGVTPLLWAWQGRLARASISRHE